MPFSILKADMVIVEILILAILEIASVTNPKCYKESKLSVWFANSTSSSLFLIKWSWHEWNSFAEAPSQQGEFSIWVVVRCSLAQLVWKRNCLSNQLNHPLFDLDIRMIFFQQEKGDFTMLKKILKNSIQFFLEQQKVKLWSDCRESLEQSQSSWKSFHRNNFMSF